MNQESRKSKFIKKLRYKYRLTVTNDSTFSEVMVFYLSRLNVFGYLGVFTIIITILVTLLFIHTPLNNFLPAYKDTQMKRQLVEMAVKMDSLQSELENQNAYFENIRRIVYGEQPDNYETKTDSTLVYDDLDFSPSLQDSILRKFVEDEVESSLSVSDESYNQGTRLESMQFFTPVKGIVSSHFDAGNQHFGIDLVADADEPVLATLSGTVIMASWTMATGYVIQIQHENNLISMYKHNSSLLKKVGDHVKAGETIAIIGNSGEETTGPHLHFELWHNGTPLNPVDYVIF